MLAASAYSRRVSGALALLVAAACSPGDAADPLVDDASSGGSSSTSSAGGMLPACSEASECRGADGDCRMRVCRNGVCGFDDAPFGSPCDDRGVICDGAGACVLKPNGELCGAGMECQSTRCVDGVCCDVDCDGQCLACNVAGVEGTCSPVPDGSDPDAECGTSCNGVGACAAAHDWSLRFGGTLLDLLADVAIDSQDNVVVAGHFYGNIDFGAGLHSSNGDNDIYVAKYDAAGSLLWSATYGGVEDDYVRGLALDGADNIVLSGVFESSIDFGLGLHSTNVARETFLAKLDPNGQPLVSRQFRGGNEHVAVDGNGAIVMVALGSMPIDFGGGPVGGSGLQLFIAKLDAAGGYLWANAHAGSFIGLDTRVTTDPMGAMLIGGSFQNTIDMGGGVLTSSGAADVFVAKYDPLGTHLFSKAFGDGDPQVLRQIATDSAGNIILSGSNAGAIDFGSGPIATAGFFDIFLAKLDPGANPIFSLGFGSTGVDYGGDVVVDSSGAVLLSALFSDSVNFGGDTLVATGSTDMAIAELGPAGQHHWSLRFGGSGYEAPCRIGVDGTGSAIFGGPLDGTIDLGGGPLTSVGGYDVFLGKLTP